MKYLILIFICMPFLPIKAQSLAEQLGYDKTAKLLIINNDDAGMCYAANQGTIQGMENGLISSATIMFACDWSPNIVQYALANPSRNFGVHLTLTSEWQTYKWGTVASSYEVPSLLDKNGKMWRSAQELYSKSNREHAYLEGKAQIERALSYGLDITHIDSHMGTFQLNPAYIEKYVQLAVEYNLPLRMASQSTHEKYGLKDLRKECKEKGLIFTDYLIYEDLQHYDSKDVETFWVDIIHNLQRGVTELYLHASVESDELKNITHSWKKRADELDAFTNSIAIKNALKQNNVYIISYRELRDLQRNKK